MVPGYTFWICNSWTAGVTAISHEVLHKHGYTISAAAEITALTGKPLTFTATHLDSTSTIFIVCIGNLALLLYYGCVASFCVGCVFIQHIFCYCNDKR